MNKLFRILVFLLALCQTKAGFCLGDTLAKTGNTSYNIVIPDNASKTEIKAAWELRKYVAATTHSTLPILAEKDAKYPLQIYVGKTKLAGILKITTAVEEDGFVIKRQKGKIFISGINDNGTLYGVFDFLEQYVKIDYLSDKIIDIPSLSVIILPKEITKISNPAFKTRDVFTDMTYNGAYNPTRNYPGGYKEWHRIKHTSNDLDNESEWANSGHTFFQLLKPDLYFKSHPEYFSLVNNKRKPEQLCLTNKDVLKIITASLKTLMDSLPEKKYYMVGQADEGHFCQCENCKREYLKYGGQKSGLMLWFVNNIAKTFPNKTIATFAYDETELAPKNINASSNVIVTIAVYFSHHNVPLNNIENKEYSDNILAWKNHCSQIMIYDYYFNAKDILAPYPNIYNMSANFKFYQASGTKHVFAQRPLFLKGSEFEELKAYVLSKLMWDPQLNADSLISSFCYKYYGAAGKYIVQYLKALDANMHSTNAVLLTQEDALNYTKTFLAPRYIKQYNAILNNAAVSVKSDQHLLDRVNNARLGVDYMLAKVIAHNQWKLWEASGYSKAEKQEAIERLRNTVKRMNVAFCADAYQIPMDKFLESVDKTAAVAIAYTSAIFSTAIMIYMAKVFWEKRKTSLA